jgi:hypothetical protein
MSPDSNVIHYSYEEFNYAMEEIYLFFKGIKNPHMICHNFAKLLVRASRRQFKKLLKSFYDNFLFIAIV